MTSQERDCRRKGTPFYFSNINDDFSLFFDHSGPHVHFAWGPVNYGARPEVR